jgi:hypothetical protein
VSAAVETFLARLYTDEALRDAFLADPGAVARREGLTGEDAAALAATDLVGIRLAAESYARKREGRVTKPSR